MKKVLAIILLLFCTSGMIFSPNGNFSCISYVPQVYNRCLAEDAEITTSDFLFEHLLCLESVAELAETGSNDDPDPLGPPYDLPQQLFQTIVLVQTPISIHFDNPVFVSTEKTYSLYKKLFVPTSYINEIFHPPCC